MRQNPSRRQFIQTCACGVAAWGLFPWFDLSEARAEGGNGTKLLVLNMNGGWDGLSVLQPNEGALYQTLSLLRPTLLQSSSSLLGLGNGYGFAPQLSVFQSLYQQGSLLAIQNVGYRNMSRSHDEAELAFAQGVADRSHPASSGYMNRLGAAYQWHTLQAVSVTGSDKVFSGDNYRGIQVNGLRQYRFNNDRSQLPQENLQRRDALYALSQIWNRDSQSSRNNDVLAGIDLVSNTTDSIGDAVASASFPVSYPRTQFGQQFQDVDVLFSSSNLGTEVAYVRRPGFDSHSSQLSILPDLLTELNDALAVFVSNMKSKGLWDKLIVVVLSEFGRTNRENGSQGTDHGGAVPVFLFGGGIQGGSVVGEILTSDLTENGWLPMRYNIVDIYRQIFARMNYDPDRVFERSGDQTLPSLFL